MESFFSFLEKTLNSITDVMFREYRTRTIFGLLLGVGLLSLGKILGNSNPNIVVMQDTYYILLGILIIYLPVICKSIVSTATVFSEFDEEFRKFIKSAKEDGVSNRTIDKWYEEVFRAKLHKYTCNREE